MFLELFFVLFESFPVCIRHFFQFRQACSLFFRPEDIGFYKYIELAFTSGVIHISKQCSNKRQITKQRHLGTAPALTKFNKTAKNDCFLVRNSNYSSDIAGGLVRWSTWAPGGRVEKVLPR